jgi:hypothetical protein
MKLEKAGFFMMGIGVFSLSILAWVQLINLIIKQIHLARHPQQRAQSPGWDFDEY